MKLEDKQKELNRVSKESPDYRRGYEAAFDSILKMTKNSEEESPEYRRGGNDAFEFFLKMQKKSKEGSSEELPPLEREVERGL